MFRTRALALLTAMACAAALIACERSTTAPLAPRASIAPSGADGLLPVAEPGATSALVDLEGGVLELGDSPGYPLHSTLTVPAGLLDAPAYFDVAREVTGDALVLRVSARPALELAPMGPRQNFTDDPIVLSLRNAGSAVREITVVFSPPDGAAPIVVKPSLLLAGQVTAIGFQRGRSKYSVIYF